MSTVRETVTKFLEGLVEVEVKKAVPFLAHLVPGAVGELLAGLVQRPDVQAKLVEWEDKAVEWVVGEIARGLDWVTAEVADHTKGNLHEAIIAALKSSPVQLSLTADQVRDLIILLSAGKLDAFIKQGLADLGLKAA